MSAISDGTIQFEGVSKRYRLGALGTLKGIVASFRDRGRTENDGRILWALNDVSFRIEPGRALGLIGPNGAGKTTALKLISNITRPTSGRIVVQGRLSSLIELGAGFHPELSGRENIHLNGAILGLKQREIARKFDAIVAFAELERFLDTPVKRYSSGMYVRLAFAVAAHIEPDVLLVDEVLAVGDSAFRQKCMARMEALRSAGTTLLFVSHNMYQVRRLCDQALLLMNGRMAFLGPTSDAIATYEEMIQVDTGEPHKSTATIEASPGGIIVTSVVPRDSQGNRAVKLQHNQSLEICTHFGASEAIQDPIVKVRLIRSDGVVVAMVATKHITGLHWTLRGTGTFSTLFEPIQLVSGTYTAEVRVIDSTDTMVLASGQSDPFAVHGTSMPHELDVGTFVPHASWNYQETQQTTQWPK